MLRYDTHRYDMLRKDILRLSEQLISLLDFSVNHTTACNDNINTNKQWRHKRNNKKHYKFKSAGGNGRRHHRGAWGHKAQ